MHLNLLRNSAYQEILKSFTMLVFLLFSISYELNKFFYRHECEQICLNCNKYCDKIDAIFSTCLENIFDAFKVRIY